MTEMNLAAWAEEVAKSQDYSYQELPRDVNLVSLKRFVDDGGSFQELFRLNENGQAMFEFPCVQGGTTKLLLTIRQVNYSVMEPGATKAWHLHRKQWDVWFVPPECKLIVGLLDCRREAPLNPSRLVLGDGKSQLLVIPPGVAHGGSNPYHERAVIVYGTSEFFSAQNPDELRLPWDYVRKTIWEVQKG